MIAFKPPKQNPPNRTKTAQLDERENALTPRSKELEDPLKAGCANGDSTLVAYCHNYLFEERVSPQRQAGYEEALQDQASDFNAWDRWHRNQYLPRAIHREIPETFTALNASAAHSGDLQKDQRLVRIERLDQALRETGLTIDELQEILSVATSAVSANKYKAIDAQAALEDICASLNRNPYSIRPRFAGFLQDVADTIDEPDWANRVRDRFGLAHIDPKRNEAMPVVLMSYPVRDVLRAACEKTGAAHPVCVPTVLDHEFTACFLPAPRQLPYGRTLQLMGDPDCEHKIAEVLHLRFAYRREHIHKVGVVTEPVTVLRGPGLDHLRREHLFCLQYESNRDDFGQLPSGWTNP